MRLEVAVVILMGLAGLAGALLGGSRCPQLEPGRPRIIYDQNGRQVLPDGRRR